MKSSSFDYHLATDVDDAIAALSQAEEGKAIAGGQSLVALMSFRLARPDVLVDINGIDELDYIEARPDGGLAIGALTRQRALERSELVRQRCPIMAEAVPQIAHAVIRNRGTIGGSLAHADSASELCTISLAVDARMKVRGPNGDREIAAIDFFQGPLTTALEPDELLTEIVIPASPSGSGSAYQEVSRRKGDFALAGVGGVIALGDGGTVRHARLAYTSLGPTALRSPAAEEFLVGRRIDDETIAGAIERLSGDLRPSESLHGTAEYRMHLAGALTKRVLVAAADRAA